MNVQILTNRINREAGTKMSNIKFIALTIYNIVVVITTGLSVYYVSPWMFFILAAVMKYPVESENTLRSEENNVHT